MMVSGKNILTSVLLLLVPTLVSAQKSWSLQDCIEHARKNNITIKQAEISTAIAKVNHEQQLASMLPSINGNASYNYNFGRSVDFLTNNITNNEVQSANFSMSGGLSIFDGLQLQNSLAQSKYDFLESGQNLEKIKNDISLNVAAAYLQVLYAQEALKSASDRVDAANETKSRTSKMVETGMLAQGNLLDAEAALASEELAKVNAENSLTSARINLVQLLELPSTDGFNLSEQQVSVPDQSSILLTPDQIFTEALKTLPEFKAAAFNIKSAEKALAVAIGGRSPSLRLNGSINSGYSKGGEQFGMVAEPFNDQIDRNFSKSVGISLTIPLFNGWSTTSNIRRSRLGLENAKLSGQLTRNQVYKSIVQAQADAAAAAKRYSASEKAFSSSRESFTYAERKYDVGMISFIDFINIRNNRSRAESELIQAKYDLIFRIKVLDFYMGKPLNF